MYPCSKSTGGRHIAWILPNLQQNALPDFFGISLLAQNSVRRSQHCMFKFANHRRERGGIAGSYTLQRFVIYLSHETKTDLLIHT